MLPGVIPRWRRIGTALVLALALVPTGARGGSVLSTLKSLDQFRGTFNRDEAAPRLILLLSPT
jgi:hypothetical protein